MVKLSHTKILVVQNRERCSDSIIQYTKINWYNLQKKQLQRSKSEGKSSTSVLSLTVLNAEEVSQNYYENGTRQLRPILKQTRKDNIFSKRYLMMKNITAFSLIF